MSAPAETPPERRERQVARRRLMLRDGLLFLALTAVALVLAGVTTVLFRSFEAYRETLAGQAAERGRADMQRGRADDAVREFRSALEYRRGDRGLELQVARALSASGHLDQAESYFLNLWQAQPGDGAINLELARVKRQQGITADAVQYYRAAVFGTWPGDAPKQRRDIRLELSAYLITLGQTSAARAELLIASGNNPDAATQRKIAELLDAAGDPSDALTDYRNALRSGGQNAETLSRIAQICYRMGDYECAEHSAQKSLGMTGGDAALTGRMAVMKQDAERLQEMSLSPSLPAETRTQHLVADAAIAHTRLTACLSANTATELTALQSAWTKLDTAKNRAALRHDDSLKEQYRSLTFATEHAVTEACGAATGDDALLLYLQSHPAIHAEVQP